MELLNCLFKDFKEIFSNDIDNVQFEKNEIPEEKEAERDELEFDFKHHAN